MFKVIQGHRVEGPFRFFPLSAPQNNLKVIQGRPYCILNNIRQSITKILFSKKIDILSVRPP